MNDLPTSNQTTEQQPAGRNRGKRILFWFGFLGLMVVFFLVGYYLTGAYRSAATPATPARVDVVDEGEWEQLPPPPKKVTATVEVSEIAPEPKPSAQPSTTPAPNTPDDSQAPSSEEKTSPVEINPEPEPARPPAAKPAHVSQQPTPTVDTKKYVVQIGIYAEKSNAEIIAANLVDHGYASSIRQTTRSGVVHYQVIVGNPRDRAGADALAAELRKSGREVAISPVD